MSSMAAERLASLGCCCSAVHNTCSSARCIAIAIPIRGSSRSWNVYHSLRLTTDGFSRFRFIPHNAAAAAGVAVRPVKVKAARQADDGVKWWEKDAGPNMRDVHSTQEFIEALASAGDKLVIVEFFATWCGSCRALFPKLCKLAEEHRDIEFVKVNFEENKAMCKRLGIKVLPFFHFYRGADGRLDAFSCSLAKLQKLKDAMELHNTDRCSLGPALGVGDLLSTLSSTSDQTAAAGSTR